MVICLERGADLHMAQLMPLPLTVSCSSKIQIGFTFLVPAHLGRPGHRAVKRLLNVCMREHITVTEFSLEFMLMIIYELQVDSKQNKKLSYSRGTMRARYVKKRAFADEQHHKCTWSGIHYC